MAEVPHTTNDYTALSVHALLFENYRNVGGRDEHVLSPVFGYTGRRMVLYLM
jgi:hypothetical protein